MAAKFFIIAFIALFALTAECTSIAGPYLPFPYIPSRPDALGKISHSGYGPSININPVNNAKSESYSQPTSDQYASHVEY